MSTEILVPFALSPSGGIAVTTDPSTQTAQHVDSLISTRPGERAMLPAYGVDLAGRLFGNQDEVAAMVVNDVTLAMQQWEPSIVVTSVQAAPNTDQVTGLVQVEVDYLQPPNSIPGGAPAPSTATVLVGGTVIEQVSP